MRVLLIDDSTVVRSRLVRLLEDLGGIDVREAEDGPDGLACARRERPDAVILDIRLRTGSGLDVLRELKRGPSPPVMNQRSVPHAGHGASPKSCDGWMRNSCPQTGQWFGVPSGVRDAMVTVGNPPQPNEFGLSAGVGRTPIERRARSSLSA